MARIAAVEGGIEEVKGVVENVLAIKVTEMDKEVAVDKAGLNQVKAEVDKLPALEAKVEGYTEALQQQQASLPLPFAPHDTPRFSST